MGVFSRKPRIVYLWIVGLLAAAASVYTFATGGHPFTGVAQAGLAVLLIVMAFRQTGEPARAHGDEGQRPPG